MHVTFVKRFLVSTALLIALIVSINLFFDPYGIYHTHSYQGINHEKNHEQGRLSVAMNLIRKKPKALALGTSRVLHGFDQANFQQFSEGEEFHNCAFAGASFEEMYGCFLHALFLQPDLKKVVIGIDLFSFNEHRNMQKDFIQDRLQRNSYRLADITATLLSAKSLSASYQTFSWSFLKNERENELLNMGEKEYLRIMLEDDSNYGHYKIGSEKIQMFQNLVTTCQEQAIDLKVFICPVKAMYWDFYLQNGLWGHLEDLKRQLCAIHPIWDFSGANPITTEVLDVGGKPLYQECSHFTPVVVNLLLQRMQGSPSIADSIGYLLTPHNVEDVLLKIKEHQINWSKSN